MKKRCEPSMQIERGISRPSSIRHQSHLTLIVEIMPDRQHTMRAVPIGAGGEGGYRGFRELLHPGTFEVTS